MINTNSQEVEFYSVPSKNDLADFLDHLGFRANYVPSEDKIARNWKRKVFDLATDTSSIPDTAAYAVIPDQGMMIVDCDRSHDDELSGIQIIRDLLTANNIESVDELELARTFRVRTPSGGWHLYYKIPHWLCGHLKAASHVRGIPIDIKCEQKGYVVGPYSRTSSGIYLPRIAAFDPENGCYGTPIIPEAPKSLCAFLIANGYTDFSEPSVHRSEKSWGLSQPVASAPSDADMSSIPEGERNDTLYRWCFGRLANHPENRDQIIRDTLHRGKISGLVEGEVKTIIKSALLSSQEVK
ncbi:MAG: bifunctional DNA primase/polymerase [Bifidobacteriaceae bacterium]|jgi:hypothetical protein|nr:bifunctional DNA primase/polymerase [Bifidobacteriaceae bacterium]